MNKKIKVLTFSFFVLSFLSFMLRISTINLSYDTNLPIVCNQIVVVINGITIFGSILMVVLLLFFKFKQNKKHLFNIKYLIINFITLIITGSSFLYYLYDLAKGLENF